MDCPHLGRGALHFPVTFRAMGIAILNLRQKGEMLGTIKKTSSSSQSKCQIQAEIWHIHHWAILPPVFLNITLSFRVMAKICKQSVWNSLKHLFWYKTGIQMNSMKLWGIQIGGLVLAGCSSPKSYTI